MLPAYNRLTIGEKPEYAIINLYFTMPFCVFPCIALKVDRKKSVNIVCTCHLFNFSVICLM